MNEEIKRTIEEYRKKMQDWDLIDRRFLVVNVGNPFEYILDPFNESDIGKWRYLTQQGKTLREEDPIRTKDFTPQNSLASFCLIAKYCGCAVILDGNKALAIGRESTLRWFNVCLNGYMLKHHAVLKRRRRSSLEDIDALGELAVTRSICMRVRSALEVSNTQGYAAALNYAGEENRIQLNRVQHKICEHYPKLRVKKSGYDVEVELRRYTENVFLSGCIFSLEYYTSGHLKQDLEEWKNNFKN